VRAQYVRAAGAASAGLAFVWRIRVEAFAWIRDLISPPRDLISPPRDLGPDLGQHLEACPHAPRLTPFSAGSCTYVEQHATSSSARLARALQRHLSLTPRAFAVMHVRRTERAAKRRTYRNACNTSIERMAAIAELIPPLFPVLLFTDDKSGGYAVQLVRLLRRGGLHRRRAYNGDQELERVSLSPRTETDNYVLFAAALEVFAAAGTQLHVCEQCPRGPPSECLPAINASVYRIYGEVEMRGRPSGAGSKYETMVSSERITGGLLRHWGFKCNQSVC